MQLHVPEKGYLMECKVDISTDRKKTEKKTPILYCTDSSTHLIRLVLNNKFKIFIVSLAFLSYEKQMMNLIARRITFLRKRLYAHTKIAWN